MDPGQAPGDFLIACLRGLCASRSDRFCWKSEDSLTEAQSSSICPSWSHGGSLGSMVGQGGGDGPGARLTQGNTEVAAAEAPGHQGSGLHGAGGSEGPAEAPGLGIGALLEAR